MKNNQKNEFDKEFLEFWKPLLQTNGKWDEKKIKNELSDLVFIYEQVDEVYCALTGGKLSKPMYYANTIITEYEQQLSDSYDEGYNDAKKELKDSK